MYLDIYEAIEHRHLIQMYYGDYSRIIEPRAYGSDSRGLDMLKAYQIAGCDTFGRHIGWKWFQAKEMEAVIVLSTHFVSQRSESTLRPRPLQRVYCQVGTHSPQPWSHERRRHRRI